jgi:hypothetical protein
VHCYVLVCLVHAHVFSVCMHVHTCVHMCIHAKSSRQHRMLGCPSLLVPPHLAVRQRDELHPPLWTSLFTAFWICCLRCYCFSFFGIGLLSCMSYRLLGDKVYARFRVIMKQLQGSSPGTTLFRLSLWPCQCSLKLFPYLQAIGRVHFPGASSVWERHQWCPVNGAHW